MENPIQTMLIGDMRRQLDELRETCLRWSHCYQHLLEENERLREKISEYESI